MKNLCTILLILTFVSISCTTSTSDINKKENYPEWVIKPPREKEYFYGVGSDSVLEKAKAKSIISAGQQFEVHIHAEISEKVRTEKQSQEIIESIESHVTNKGIIGAKYYDQFQDGSGNYWVLTRAPINCILDVTESVLLSYQRELKMAPEEVEKRLETIRNKVINSDKYYHIIEEKFTADGKFRREMISVNEDRIYPRVSLQSIGGNTGPWLEISTDRYDNFQTRTTLYLLESKLTGTGVKRLDFNEAYFMSGHDNQNWIGAVVKITENNTDYMQASYEITNRDDRNDTIKGEFVIENSRYPEMIRSMTPAPGSRDVPPDISEIVIVFTKPMLEKTHISFTNGVEDISSEWSQDGMTLTLKLPEVLPANKKVSLVLNPSQGRMGSRDGYMIPNNSVMSFHTR